MEKNNKKKLIDKLDEKIPRDQIMTRDAGYGVVLDYVSGFYVISTLNSILGQGNWGYDIAPDYPKCIFQGSVNVRGKDVFQAHYITKLSFWARLGSKTDSEGNTTTQSLYSDSGFVARFDEIGYGNGQDKYNPGAPHELAAKESVTDALKRAAKNLGMRLGLALYDKTREFIDESTKTSKPKAPKTDSEKLDKAQALIKVIVSRGLRKATDIHKFMTSTYAQSDITKLSVDQVDSLLVQLENVLNTQESK